MQQHTFYEPEDVEIVDLNAKPLPPKQKKTTMLVSEMAKLLGIHKTDSYWLVHKNYFKTINAANRMRVDIASFEEWYEGQIKYKKVNGPPPGARLREESYDARDISRMLGVSESYVYDILCDVECIIVDYWKRWTKEAFMQWYENQTKYRTLEDRKRDKKLEQASMSMPEMAWLLGISRSKVYDILNHKANKGVFKVFKIAERKRITKESFFKWYEAQSKYKMIYDSIEEAQSCKPKLLPNERYIYDDNDLDSLLPEENIDSEQNETVFVEQIRTVKPARVSTNPNFVSVDEVMRLLDISRKTVKRKILSKEIPAIMIAGTYRIPKTEFEEWLTSYHSQDKEEN